MVIESADWLKFLFIAVCVSVDRFLAVSYRIQSRFIVYLLMVLKSGALPSGHLPTLPLTSRG